MIEYLMWLLKGSPTIHYRGYHCECCGKWINGEFDIPTYKSCGKFGDTWGLCNECERREIEIPDKDVAKQES